MKKHLLITCLFVLFLSCEQGNKTTVKILDNVDSQSLPTPTILKEEDDSHYLYDLKVNDSHLFTLDKNSDTILRAYDLQDINKLTHLCLRGIGKSKLNEARFAKSCSRYSLDKNQVCATDNNQYIATITFSDTDTGIQIKKDLIAYIFRNSIDYNIAKNEIYAVPINSSNMNTFYFFNQDSGFYWVDTPSLLLDSLPDIPSASLSNLCVNEQAETIVSAYRFMNAVAFYDLRGELRKLYQIGKKRIIPYTTTSKGLDLVDVPKCFMDICGNDQNIYCLYNGTSDFDTPSQIWVFSWDGRHITTWKADRPIRAISIDKNGKNLFAITNKAAIGQEIIKYSIK